VFGSGGVAAVSETPMEQRLTVLILLNNLWWGCLFCNLKVVVFLEERLAPSSNFFDTSLGPLRTHIGTLFWHYSYETRIYDFSCDLHGSIVLVSSEQQ
jgi:hypothetical protein